MQSNLYQAAGKVIERIVSRERQMATYPGLGRIEEALLGLAHEYRYVIQGNYKLIYRHSEENVFVIRVFDTRQDPEKLSL